MTRNIDGEKYYRLDALHALAAFVGLMIGAGGALITLDSRYAAKSEMEEVKRLVTEQAATTQNLMILLKTHLAIDDPRFRNHVNDPSADVLLNQKGD